MKTKLVLIIFYTSLLCLNMACSNKNNNSGTTETNSQSKSNESDLESKKETSILILDHSILDISVGDQISLHKASIEKDMLSNGEGDFIIFRINHEEFGTLGHFYPEPNDESLVGLISITSKIPKTVAGIHVGSTFEDLLTAHSEVDVHGSEIEGRTHAYSGNLSYLLNINNFSYTIDQSTIPLDTEIIAIMINR